MLISSNYLKNMGEPHHMEVAGWPSNLVKLVMMFTLPNQSVICSSQTCGKLLKIKVTVTSDDAEAARNAEIAVLFTPFGKSTFNIAKNIIKHLPENGVIANTCTVSPLVLYYVLELEIKRKKE